MTRLLIALILSLTFAGAILPSAAFAQAGSDRSSTGGGQTLEDIMARQRGEKIDDRFRREAVGGDNSAAAISSQLGTLGGVSDPELWRALRYGSADINASSGGAVGTILVQDGGMGWVKFRNGPLASRGGYFLLITLIALGLFYAARGKIMIDGKKAGRTITRFKAIERFGHWLLAGSFILLGLTGLITLFGRMALIPIFGKDVFAMLAEASKWVHNNVSWAFMLGLVIVFIMWVIDNLPGRTDLKWLAKGGGLLVKGVHPPAKKFNAGQKLIFWSVIILGTSISASGLSMLFPFEMPMFAATFETLAAIGITSLPGYGPLPTELLPHEEMQVAQLWHAIAAFVLMAIVMAHIYIGSVGMEGAYDAMGSGEVDLQWAREHHSLWVEEITKAEGKAPDGGAVPAE